LLHLLNHPYFLYKLILGAAVNKIQGSDTHLKIGKLFKFLVEYLSLLVQDRSASGSSTALESQN
jgi:hypothetical protein